MSQGLTVFAHKRENGLRELSKSSEFAIDFLDQILKLGEITQMSGFGLEITPKILNGIKVRGVRWESKDGQPVCMVSKELLHGF